MNKTTIEWVKNPDGKQGYTLNQITGCHNHKNGLCNGGGFPCYAYKLAYGRTKKFYLSNRNLAPFQFEDGNLSLVRMDAEAIRHNPFYPRLWEDRTIKADMFLKSAKKPLGIFLCDMSDWVGIGIPYDWSNLVYCFMIMHPRHRFYLLTKQPQNLIKFSPFPDNCYVGVTVCNNGMMTIAMQYLSMIQARVKFISFEPLLGEIGMNDHMSMKGIVHWVIIGSQTKPYNPPRYEWVREIVTACDKASIPVFLKNNLIPLLCGDDKPFKSDRRDLCWLDVNMVWNLREEMP